MAGAAVLGRLNWHLCTVIALRDETATARTIALQVPDWPGHVAGQRVDLRVTAADGYSAVREYSIASAPRADGHIELSVERLPDGEVSPYLTQDLMVGDRVEVRGPIGGWFVWRDDQIEPIQLVAGGSGIVPLMRAFGTSMNCRRSRLTAASPSLTSTRVQRLPTGRDRRDGSMRQSFGTPAGPPAFPRHATSAARHRSSSTSLTSLLSGATVPSGSELSGSGPREITHNTIEGRVL